MSFHETKKLSLSLSLSLSHTHTHTHTDSISLALISRFCWQSEALYQIFHCYGMEPSSISGFRSGRPKPYEESASPQSGNRAVPWRNFDTSVNAISFGFVATAILISMFLIMAIFEHLLRPRPPPFPSSHAGEDRSLGLRPRVHMLDKLGNPCTVSVGSTIDFSVVMPGQDIPTFIAHPAPLPCNREGISWPSHDNGLAS
ncbi:hypothetical protein AMTRI_Chr11g101180 [Amborella trichopoda]